MPLRSFTQAEMLLTERRRFEYPLLILAWLGVGSFSLIEGNYFYAVAGTLAVAVNLLAARRRKEVSVGRLFVNIGVLMATGILILEVFFLDKVPLIALGHYMILIQLCKLFERKTNRDYVQILALSMLLMVAAALLSSAIWFAALLVVYLTLASHTAMIFTLKRDLDAAAAGRLRSEPSPMAPQRVAWNVIRVWPGRALRGRLVTVMVAILATGLLVFLITPRPAGGAGEATRGGDASRGVTGFSDTVRLGAVDRVYSSSKVAMRVRLRTGDGSPPALAGDVYLRGKTFDAYRHSRWSRTSSPIISRRADTLPVPPPRVRPDRVLIQEISMGSWLLPTLFTAYPVVGVDTPTQTRILPDGQVSTGASARAGGTVKYLAYSWLGELSPEQRRYLESLYRSSLLPRHNKNVEVTLRVREEARRWCRELLQARRRRPHERDKFDLAIARHIANELRSRYTYSLEMERKDPDRDGIEHFLFHMKKGHCEYFASAMTVMCSSLDVRARLVTGFRLDEQNREGDEYVVRERDAHAWTEVYTPATDWVVIDATPPGQARSTRTAWSSLEDFWERVQFLWQETVAGYDDRARRQLFDGAAGWAKACWASVRDVAGAVRNSFVNLLVRGVIDRVLVRLMLFVGLVGLVLELLIVGRLIRRSLRRDARDGRQWTLEKVTFAKKLFKLLRRHGVSTAPGKTPVDVADEAANVLRLPADTLRSLVGLYYRMRWGYYTPGAEELVEAEKQVASLAGILAEAAGKSSRKEGG